MEYLPTKNFSARSLRCPDISLSWATLEAFFPLHPSSLCYDIHRMCLHDVVDRCQRLNSWKHPTFIFTWFSHDFLFLWYAAINPWSLDNLNSNPEIRPWQIHLVICSALGPAVSYKSINHNIFWCRGMSNGSFLSWICSSLILFLAYEGFSKVLDGTHAML